jgi:hypothetical protein
MTTPNVRYQPRSGKTWQKTLCWTPVPIEPALSHCFAFWNLGRISVNHSSPMDTTAGTRRAFFMMFRDSRLSHPLLLSLGTKLPCKPDDFRSTLRIQNLRLLLPKHPLGNLASPVPEDVDIGLVERRSLNTSPPSTGLPGQSRCLGKQRS